MKIFCIYQMTFWYLLRLRQEESEPLNRPIKRIKIQQTENTLPKKSWGKMVSPMNYTKYLKNCYKFSSIYSTLKEIYKFFHTHSIIPALFSYQNLIFFLKKMQSSITDQHRCKNPQQEKPSLIVHLKIIHCD